LTPSDKSRSAPSRKRSKKTVVRPPESPLAGTTEAKKQATELHARLQELSRRAAELENRVGELNHELEKTRNEARESDARATELERRSQRVPALEEEAAALRRRLAESEEGRDAARKENGRLETQAAGLKQQVEASEARISESNQRVGALERELIEAREAEAKAREDSLRELEEVRRRLAESEEGRDAARKENARLESRAQSADTRTSEANRRIGALERELVEAREAEAKARAGESQAAQLRETAERLRAETARLEKTRSEQQRWLEELGQTVVDLERQLQEAGSTKPAKALPPPAPSEPAAPPPPPMAETTLRPQHLFGPVGADGHPSHVLQELLFRDAAGVVYRARERATGRTFAARFVAGQAGEEQTLAIEREVERLIALPHPNILHVQGSGRRKNRLYLMMDLVEAPTLGQAKIRDIRRVCAVVRDAAEAVHYAHEEGILHGDLNPENILVASPEGRDHALVKDFGLGRLLESLVPLTPGKDAGTPIRNPAYLPPEQTRALKPALSPSVDVYGLGATLYAALAGRPPFEGKDMPQVLTRVMFEEPLPLERVRPDVPEALAATVRRAMAKESGHRFGSAKELADALTRFLIP